MGKRYYDYVLQGRKRCIEKYKSLLDEFNELYSVLGVEPVEVVSSLHPEFDECERISKQIRGVSTALRLSGTNVKDQQTVVSVLQAYAEALAQLATEEVAYSGVVLHRTQSSLAKLARPTREFILDNLKFLEDAILIESSLVFGKYTYAVACWCTVTTKHRDGSGPKYYCFTTDTYKYLTNAPLGGSFQHLSTVFIREDCDNLWVRHADDNMTSLDTSTIIVSDNKLKVYKSSLDMLLVAQLAVEENICDGWAFLLILSLITGATKYYEKINGEAKTVRINTKRVSKTHVPKELTDGIEVYNPYDDAEKTRYIPVERVREHKEYVKKAWQGGHHNSPIGHDVSEHDRYYKNGKVVHIAGYHKPGRDGKVNKVYTLD